ncbi:MAG: hypothetical protein SPI94_04060 [Candidatus Onthovivens sp.]|nr:hypothetical protein [Candidatus Onthovivens sp.]
MIQSVNENIEVLVSNSSTISFLNDDVRTRKANCCNWLQHNEGSPIYKILEGGIYKVSFNANVTSATAGTVALGLYQDGILIPGTTVIAEVATAGDYINVSFDKLIKICCRGDASLTIGSVPSVLTGATLPGTPTVTEIPVIQNANLSITKKC